MERLRVFVSIGLLSLALVISPAVQVAPAVAASSLTFVTLDFPGAVSTRARGVNNAGQVVGYYVDVAGRTHGFLYSGGTFTTLTINIPGVAIINSQATGINNLGQIVGTYDNHGFLLSGGAATTIDVPGARFTNPMGINDSGQIVGRYCDQCFFGIAKGFLYSGGTFQTIPNAPGALPGATDAEGINNAGQIVGAFETGDGRVHGYLLSGGAFTTIDFPGALGTYAFGINKSGQVVGMALYVSPTFFVHGFLFSGGTFTIIDPPGAVQIPYQDTTAAMGINDSGQIVGFYKDSTFKDHGYLASPFVKFAAFSANVAISNSKKQFAVGGQFTLGAGSSGINPMTQDVTIQVGGYSTTIPAGSFQADAYGNYFFQGTINGVQLAAAIQPQGGNAFGYAFGGQGADNMPTTNPVTVGLTIGNNTGSTSVNAVFQSGGD